MTEFFVTGITLEWKGPWCKQSHFHSPGPLGTTFGGHGPRGASKRSACPRCLPQSGLQTEGSPRQKSIAAQYLHLYQLCLERVACEVLGEGPHLCVLILSPPARVQVATLTPRPEREETSTTPLPSCKPPSGSPDPFRIGTLACG